MVLRVFSLFLVLVTFSCTSSKVELRGLRDSETGRDLALYVESGGFSFLVDTGSVNTTFSKAFVLDQHWNIEQAPYPAFDLVGRKDFEQVVEKPHWKLGSLDLVLEKGFLSPALPSPTLQKFIGLLPAPFGGMVGIDAIGDCRLEFQHSSIWLSRDGPAEVQKEAPWNVMQTFSWILDSQLVPVVFDTGYGGGVVEIRYAHPALNVTGFDRIRSDLVPLAFSGGVNVLPELTRVDSIKFGSQYLRNLTLAALQGPTLPETKAVPGYLLVGLDFLKSHKVILDWKRRTMTLGDSTDPMIRNEWDLLALSTRQVDGGQEVVKVFPSHPWYQFGLRNHDVIVARNHRWEPRLTHQSKQDLAFMLFLLDSDNLLVRRGTLWLSLQKDLMSPRR